MKYLNNGINISWLEPENLSLIKTGKFIGYNIYRLTENGNIQKKPINENPILSTNFLDKKINNKNPQYTVRAIFEFEKKIYQGPASNIGRAYLSNKSNKINK